jgi:hypothetical protein
MAGSYRITVKGVMSERFCRGLGAVPHPAGSGRTILEGDLPDEGRLNDVLARLDNLGLEVIEVVTPRTAATDGKDD